MSRNPHNLDNMLTHGSVDYVARGLAAQSRNAVLTNTVQLYDTTIQMTAATAGNLVDGMSAFVRGYNTRYDFGGGNFVWDAAATDAVDNGMVFQLNAGGTGRWKRIIDGGALWIGWFGAKPTPGFDNGPAIRAAKNAANLYGLPYASRQLAARPGVFEIRSDEADNSAGVRWLNGGGMSGASEYGTVFWYYTATANRPCFLVAPLAADPHPCSYVKMERFAVWPGKGTAFGSGVTVNPTLPSAERGHLIDGVVVVDCQDGISIIGSGSTTVYGGTVVHCSVQGVRNTGRGFYTTGNAYSHWSNNEGYTQTDTTGETGWTFYLQCSGGIVENCRAGDGPIYLDCPNMRLDVTVESMYSACAHNGNAAVLINRHGSIRCILTGAKRTAAAGPTYGLIVQDDRPDIEYFWMADIDGAHGSPTNPIGLNATITGGRINNAYMSAAGAVKMETYCTAAQLNNLRITNSSTVVSFGKWTKTFDPPSIAAGGVYTTTVACSRIALGSVVHASWSAALGGVLLSANVSAADVVTLSFYNPTAGAIDLASGTATVNILN